MSAELTWLEDRLNGVGAAVVIDGGMGTELEKSGVPMDNKIWSAASILSHPEAVRQAHESFIDAGAEVIITNTFSAARHMLEPNGYGDRVRDINRKAVELARQARDSVARQPVAIAGSICEWTSSDDPNWQRPEVVGGSAREQAELLAEAGADLIALEMCERLDFSCAVVNAVLEVGLPLWIGVSAQSYTDSQYLSVFDLPELKFENLVEGLAEFPAMMMTIMHTPISDVVPAHEIVKSYWDGPVGIYPESGYFTMPNWQFVDIIEPDVLAELAQVWVNDGVRMIGGCCGIGPGHIEALGREIKQTVEDM